MKAGSNEDLMDSESSKDFHRLEDLSSTLKIKIESYESLVKNFERLRIQLKALLDLSDIHDSSSSLLSSPIPFKTWPLSKFCSVAGKIWSMHKDELAVKRAICNEICILDDKLMLSFYEAEWKHELNIDTSELNLLLDGIICELELFSQLSK